MNTIAPNAVSSTGLTKFVESGAIGPKVGPMPAARRVPHRWVATMLIEQTKVLRDLGQKNISTAIRTSDHQCIHGAMANADQ